MEAEVDGVVGHDSEDSGQPAQAGRALGKAHAAGVVHRDLKPANLFLTTREDGSTSVKILDFGISKLVRGDANEESSSGKTSLLTREGAVMGTPMYMSPEQAQGLPVDARSDVWSLASVLYEALAGRTAYEHRDTYEQMIVQIVTKKPRPIEEVAPWVPASIARVIEAALAHDVEQRTSDAAVFAKSLAAAAREPGELSGTDAVAAPSSDHMLAATSSRGAASPPTAAGVVVATRGPLDTRAGKRGRTGMIAIVAAALAAAITVVVLVTREPTPKGTSQGGLVAAPASAESTPVPAPSASTSTVLTTLLPASAAAVAPSAPSSAQPLAKATPDAGAAHPKPTSTAAQPTSTTKGGPSQYGAAGVSTAY